MKKLIATTALALIIGGPAVAQATQQTDQQTGQDQQMQAEGQQQTGQDQQMMAGGQGFYQPQANDMFISNLMDAQIYAPQQRDAQMQQDGQQQAGQQQAGAAGTQQDEGAEVEVTVEDAEGDTETETIATGADDAEGQVATGAADDQDDQLQQQQADMQDDQDELTGQQEQAGVGGQEGTQPGQQATDGMQAQQMDTGGTGQGQQLQTRDVTQDELDQYENVGSVSDIIVDEQGQFRAVVFDVGGFLGMGAREVALDIDQIEFARDAENPDQMFVISQVGADQLDEAPEFDRAQLEDQREQQAGMAQTGQDGQVQQQQQQAADAGPDAQQAGQDQMAAQPGAQQDGWRGDRQAMAAPQMQREGFQQAEAAEVTADNLLGANVYDINDENIGSVSDIVMGADGQAEYAVIDIGGFLGLGTHTVAIGFDEMQVLHDDGWADLRVYVDATQEELENMPEYEQN